MLIWNQLKTRAAGQPEKLALICGDTALTYAQFAAQVENVAHTWLRKGLKPGDRIALHMRNGIELATCYYACFAAGFVAVPVNTRLTPEEIAYVLDHSGAKAYLAQADLRIQTSIPSWELDVDVRQEGAERPLPDPASRRSRPAPLHQRNHRAAQGRQPFAAHTGRKRILYGGVGPETRRSYLTLHGYGHATGSIMLLMSSLWQGATVTIVPVFDPATVLNTGSAAVRPSTWGCRR